MVDGGALVMMMAMILSKFPIPAGCQNGVSGSKSWFLMVATERNSSLENIEPPSVFRSRGNLYAHREPEGVPGVAAPP